MNQAVFFTIENTRYRVHSIFTTEQEAFLVKGSVETLMVIKDVGGLFFVVYQDVEPNREPSAVLRLTAREVRHWDSSLTDDEVREVLGAVENDMCIDPSNVEYWIGEVVANRARKVR